MPVFVQSLGSGSSGNALVIDASDGPLLIDCGLSPRALEGALAGAGYRLADLVALLLTHEHADHVRAVPHLIKRRVPLFATTGTARSLDLPAQLWEALRPGRETRLGRLTVRPLPVSHDAAEPCGFVVEGDGARLTVVTDLGRADEALAAPIAASDLIVLEANHDEAMLRGGPYPAPLKRRVLSPVGHLSNAECGRFLAGAIGTQSGVRTIWLAHLSQTNNRPPLAVRTVSEALLRRGQAHAIAPLPRHGLGPVWRSDGGPAAPVQLALPLV